MSLGQVNNRPSTPSSSAPVSPADSRDVALGTPFQPSHQSLAGLEPATPQSLKISRSRLTSKNSYNQSHMLTPLRDPSSANASNWRVHQDNPSDDSVSPTFKSLDHHASVTTAALGKHSGPFTPQVCKKSRDPLNIELSNHPITLDQLKRGSLTDPPPRRRTEPPLKENGNEAKLIKPLDVTLPTFVNPEATQNLSCAESAAIQNICASCGSFERLSLLQPCLHHICAPCVTGSLDAISGKTLVCMRCSTPVRSFKIADSPNCIQSAILSEQTSNTSQVIIRPSNRIEPCNFRSNAPFTSINTGDLTYVPAATTAETVVLRIENVPWDVTPPMLEAWLGNPTIHCHVLLDRKDGRTLSHAYIEVTEGVAMSALRSHQNKVLGHGRRIRPAVLTRSRQEELMHDLFPSWTGKFKGTAPVYEAANGSDPPSPEFLTKPELYVMVHLIQSPGSHFLKVPCLAYWSLVSTLAKVPALDVFAPASDLLFDITFYALEKYETLVGTREYDCILHTKLISAAIHCQAFTNSQRQMLLRFTNHSISKIDQHFGPSLNTSAFIQDHHCNFHAPYSQSLVQPTPNGRVAQHRMHPRLYASIDPCDRVAQEFGIDPTLVHALADRLILHSSSANNSFGQH